MDRNGDGFRYLKQKFPKISDAKIKEGVSVGPQIRDLLSNKNLIRSKYLHGHVFEILFVIFLETTRPKTMKSQSTASYQLTRIWDAICRSRYTSYTLIWIFFLKIWEPLVMNTASDSIRIYPTQNNGTKSSESVHVG